MSTVLWEIGRYTVTDEAVVRLSYHNAKVAEVRRACDDILDEMRPPWVKIPRQRSVERIELSEVGSIVRKYNCTNDLRVKLRDSAKKLVDIDQLKKFVSEDNTDKLPYITMDQDCEDFSDILLGMIKMWDSSLCIGYCEVFKNAADYEGYHAVNCVVSTDRKLYLLEPQTDGIFELPSKWAIRVVQF